MADGSKARVKVTFGTGTTAVASAEVSHLVIDDHDRLIDEARITIDDGFGLVGHGVAKGQDVKVEYGWNDEFTLLFCGKVTELCGVTTTDNATSSTTVVAHDPSVAMENNRAVLTATEGESLSRFISRVMAENYAGIHKGDLTVSPDPIFTAPNLPVSTGLSHFRFLQKLAAKWGCKFFVECSGNENKWFFTATKALWAADPMGELKMCKHWGELREFRYERVAPLAARRIVSAAIDPISGETVRADSGPAMPEIPAVGTLSPSVAEAEPEVAAAPASLGAAVAATPPEANPDEEVRTDATDPDSANAHIVQDPTRVSGLRASARSNGHLELKAKGRIKITGMAPWAVGDWWVSRVQHIYTRQDQKRPSSDNREPRGTYECELELTR